MDIIRVLPEDTAQLIAAGEVVESPASVVKELIENSIDAGARKIKIEIQNGGVSLIRVTDNGKGMSENDAKNCFLRHATSKIKKNADLYKIKTLGFRGEALASIAAVAKVRLTTAQSDSREGYCVCIEGGKIIESEPIGCSKGTIISVKDLFYNTPARRKFLKSERAESGAIASLIDRLALSHPDVSFTYVNNGKEELFTPGDKKLKSTVMAVWGSNYSSQLLEVNHLGIIDITGYISKPLFCRGSRQMQLVFVNNRVVNSRLVSMALEDAYKNSIMKGKFPACVLYIKINPELIDVNVHPAKSVVKFSNENLIYSTIKRSISAALNEEKQQYTAVEENQKPSSKEITKQQLVAFAEGLVERPAKQGTLKTIEVPEVINPIVHKYVPPEKRNTTVKAFAHTTIDQVLEHKINNFPSVRFNDIAKKVETSEGDKVFVINAEDIPKPPEVPTFEIKEDKPEEIEITPPEVTYIGEVLKSYIIAQGDNEVYIIDKHAAHERLIFEKLKNSVGSLSSQPLLISQNIDLDKADKTLLMENMDVLNKCGFEIEDMWGYSVSVKALPQILTNEDTESVLIDIADSFRHGNTDIELDKLNKILEITACKAAVKAGQKNAPEELQRLINDIFSIPDVKYCPHGRPIIYTLTQKDFEKFFKRIV